MKKNILTIILLAMTLINLILSCILIFVVVPVSMKNGKIINRVAQIIDLELEASGEQEKNIEVSDIEPYNLPERLTIRLKSEIMEDGSQNSKKNYALVFASLSLHTKHDDYKKLQPFVEKNVNTIEEYITEEFSKYTVNEVDANKEIIREKVLERIHDLFQSDFIIGISFGNLILE